MSGYMDINLTGWLAGKMASWMDECMTRWKD